jgi:uncharacterized protein (TIGR03435 family)
MFRGGHGIAGFNGPMTMTSLARLLSNRLRQPMQDFNRPQRNIQYRTLLRLPPTADLFTAIRDSLGLRLEPRKEPVEVLVIDHIERVPTEN